MKSFPAISPPVREPLQQVVHRLVQGGQGVQFADGLVIQGVVFLEQGADEQGPVVQRNAAPEVLHRHPRLVQPPRQPLRLRTRYGRGFGRFGCLDRLGNRPSDRPFDRLRDRCGFQHRFLFDNRHQLRLGDGRRLFDRLGFQDRLRLRFDDGFRFREVGDADFHVGEIRLFHGFLLGELPEGFQLVLERADLLLQRSEFGFEFLQDFCSIILHN